VDFRKEDNSQIKYDSTLYTLENGRGRTNYFYNSFSFESCEPRNSGSKEDQSRGRQFFRAHYRKHSKQLVGALKNWEKQLQFTSYEYKEGLFTPEGIEPGYVPYIHQMKEHLNKAYQGLLLSPLDIETNRKSLCSRIQSLMVYKSDAMPGRPSFEKIIVDSINNLCPILKMSNDKELEGNNIYGGKFIFNKIFDYVSSGKSTMNLKIKPDVESNVKMLWYEGTKGFARGEQETMEKLKGAIEGLLTDSEIVASRSLLW
jgi:hypothetical protein